MENTLHLDVKSILPQFSFFSFKHCSELKTFSRLSAHKIAVFLNCMPFVWKKTKLRLLEQWKHKVILIFCKKSNAIEKQEIFTHQKRELWRKMSSSKSFQRRWYLWSWIFYFYLYFLWVLKIFMEYYLLKPLTIELTENTNLLLLR